MQIKNNCSHCHRTGHVLTSDPYQTPTDIPCPYCDGVGYKTTDIIGSELDDIIAKIDAIKEVVDQIKIKTKA
jgi:hypothetical protein